MPKLVFKFYEIDPRTRIFTITYFNNVQQPLIMLTQLANLTSYTNLSFSAAQHR